MGFQKKKVIIGQHKPLQQTNPGTRSPAPPDNTAEKATLPQGVKPSPLDGRLTTSSGTASLDQLLAGHSGLPLGTSLLLEEHGTTDFGGIALRYFAAQGLVHGHHVHVLGYGEAWKMELPGLVHAATASKRLGSSSGDEERGKLKIAWRYEYLGAVRERVGGNTRKLGKYRWSTAEFDFHTNETHGGAADEMFKFCHNFDLGKRLDLSCVQGSISFYPSSSFPIPEGRAAQKRQARPLADFIHAVQSSIAVSAAGTLHRVVVPSLLSPALYSSACSHPTEVLQFTMGLRALLRHHNDRLVAMLTLPISLYPRPSGLIRWVEHCCDGVLELSPLSQSHDNKQVQGQVRQHCLPVHHERGGGWEDGGWQENLSFKLSSNDGLVIEPHSLPPVDDELSDTRDPGQAKDKNATLDF